MNCGGARRQVDLCYVIPDTLGKAGLSDADCLVSSLHVDQVLLCPCETNPSGTATWGACRVLGTGAGRKGRQLGQAGLRLGTHLT